MLLVKGRGIWDRRLAVRREGCHVVIPLSRSLTVDEIAAVKKRIRGAEVAVNRFVVESGRAKTLHEALAGRLPPQLLAKLPRSMDIVGEVAIVEVPAALDGYKRVLGEAILKSRRGIRMVLAKAGAVGGDFRLRGFEVIAGSGETETVYREHGCVYYLDLTKVYFSPRLSTERLRVARKVKSGETVVDLFAGVGPFSVLIAKSHRDAVVYAVDANPDAVQFLERNVAANRLNNVFPLLGDAREVAEKILLGRVDRVIMNLPERALEFVDVACRVLKSSGGVIHYYGFEAEPDTLGKAEEKLSMAILVAGRTRRFLESRLVRQVAPHEWQVAVDVWVF